MWSLLLVLPFSLLFVFAAPWRVHVDAGLQLPEGLLAMQIGLGRIPLLRLTFDFVHARLYVQGKPRLPKAAPKGERTAHKIGSRIDIPRLVSALRLSGRVGLLVGAGTPYTTAILVGALSSLSCGKVHLRVYACDRPVCKGAFSLAATFRPLRVLSALVGR